MKIIGITWSVLKFLGSIPTLIMEFQAWRRECEMDNLRNQNLQYKTDDAIKKAVDDSEGAVDQVEDNIRREESDGKVGLDFTGFNRRK